MSLNEFCERVKLGDLFDFMIGVRLIGTKLVEGGRGIAIVRGSDIAKPQLSYEDLVRVDFEDRGSKSDTPTRRGVYSSRSEIPPELFLQPGDLLLPRVTQSPRCLTVPDGWRNCLPSDSVLVMRRKVDGFDTEPIRQFLSSTMGSDTLSRIGSTHGPVRITPSEFKHLQIPIIPPDLASSLAEAEQIENKFNDEGNRLRRLRESILSANSKDQLESSLKELKGQLLAAKLGVSQSSDLGFDRCLMSD
jgi:hypothetical protein